MATEYTYSVSVDFPNGKVDLSRLTFEIQGSTIVTALDHIETNGDVCSIWFKAALSSGDTMVLDGIVAAHSGEPLSAPIPALDSLNRAIIVPQAQVDGESRIIVSHRWTDPCTWYGDSQRETGFALTDSGDGLRFTSGKVHWIDLTHGRIFREDRVSAPYLAKVYVDGVEKAERPAFEDIGGDYEVNYELGEVTFFSSQSGKTVTADFSSENGSTFYIRPGSGKKLWVEKSEAQFSVDSVMRDTLLYQIELVGAPLGTLAAALGVSIDSLSHVYKTWFDFVEESNGAYPVMPAIGGGTKRGLVSSSVNVPFGFGPAVELKSSDGVEIRIWLKDDIAYDGEAASVTSYCTEYDE